MQSFTSQIYGPLSAMVRDGLRIVTAIFVVSSFASAALASDVEEQIEKINQEVSAAQKTLDEVRVHEKDLQTTYDDLKSQVEKLKYEQERAAQDLKQNEVAQKQFQQDVADLESRMSGLKQLADKRVRALYISRADAGSFLDAADISRAAFYTGRIRKSDEDLLETLKTLHQARSEKQRELLRLNGVIRAQSQRLTTQKKQLTAKLREREEALSSLKAERIKLEELLAALKAQALRLDTVVTALTAPEQPEIPKSKEPELKDSAAESGSVHGPFMGQGLLKQKGELLLPVTGKVLSRFGKSRAPTFEDYVFHKGWEMSAPADTPAHAVASGVVIFVGRMPGYGTIAIVDHGERYYTLYGRLSEVSVNKGQVLQKGDIVGQLGQADSSGRNFYFEIRKDGHPLDPQSFFRRKAGKDKDP